MAKKKTPKVGKAKKAGTSKEAAVRRRQFFVEAYIGNGGNATSAAISAGYSKRSAYSTAHEILKEPEVKQLLEQRRQQVAERLEIKTERILRRLMVLAEADITQFLDAKGNVLPPAEWPAEARGAVQALKWGKFGPEIKLHDVKGAVETAMKHLGLFKKDNEQAANPLVDMLKRIAERGAPKPGAYGAKPRASG